MHTRLRVTILSTFTGFPLVNEFVTSIHTHEKNIKPMFVLSDLSFLQRWLEVHRHFECKYYVHLQGRRVSQEIYRQETGANQNSASCWLLTCLPTCSTPPSVQLYVTCSVRLPWKWRRYVPPKCGWTSATLYGVRSEKNVIFINIVFSVVFVSWNFSRFYVVIRARLLETSGILPSSEDKMICMYGHNLTSGEWESGAVFSRNSSYATRIRSDINGSLQLQEILTNKEPWPLKGNPQVKTNYLKWNNSESFTF
jgi:hypothetical protein